jgi:adenylate cyclase
LKWRLALVPHSDMTRFYLASVYGHTGRHENTQRVWRELLEIRPDFSVEHFRRVLPYRDPALFDWIVQGIRNGGSPFNAAATLSPSK